MTRVLNRFGLVISVMALIGLAAYALGEVRAGGVGRAQASSTNYLSGTGFDTAHSDFTFTSVKSFSDFNLYAPATEFEGFKLTRIVRRLNGRLKGDLRKKNFVSFVYGSCIPATGEDSCAPPLEIQVWPACERTRVDYTLTPAGDPLPREGFSIRGIPAAYFDVDGRLELYTGDVTIVLFGVNREFLVRAGDALEGINVHQPSGTRLPVPRAAAMTGELIC